MPEKKITVLGDAGDPSLSPEEEHKIEVKVDRMLSVEDDHPDHELLDHDQAAPVEPSSAEEPAEVEVTEPTMPAGAPPLNKRLAKKIIISDASEAAESLTVTTPAIADVETEPAALEAIEPDEPTEPLRPAEPEIPEAAAEEPEYVETPVKTALEPTDTLAAESVKKYHPPDGPMPFKRAEPTAETSKDPEAAVAATMTAEEQENAAIAAAFAVKEPKASQKSHRAKRPVRKRALALGVVLILIAGLALAILAMPSLRDKLSLSSHKSVATNNATKSTTAVATSQTKAATDTPVPDIFLAKSDGIYNLYKVDPTGQNKQELLAGSGYETSPTTQLVVNQSATLAALVSLRDGSKDAAGYPIETLDVVDAATGTRIEITAAQRIQILGWYDDRLVYVASKTGAAAASDPNAYQLTTYDMGTKKSQVLDHATHFNAVLAIHDQLYYATDGNAAALYRIKPDGSGKQIMLNKLVTNVYRTGYDSMALATAGGWYTLDTAVTTAKPVSTVNAYNGTNKLYVDSPDQRHSLHLENQNGTPTLLLYTVATKKDTTLSQQAGLSYPLHWQSNSVAVYRIDTNTQTADYTVNTTTATSAKLTDTSSFHGLEP